jgi:outer membrane lipoprotein LolB
VNRFTQRILLRAAIVGALLLAACAITPPAPVRDLTATEQQTVLRELPGYTLDGRVAVRSGDQGWQASVHWLQRGDVSEVRLSGPFGAGALRLRLQGGELQLTDSRGHKLQGEQATRALNEQLGFMPPLESLRYWLLALPDAATAEPAATVSTPAELAQRDWQLRYEDYRSEATLQGNVRVPRKLTATREAIRLRLVVDRWRLRPGK